MMRLESDLIPALMASARDLSGIDLTRSQDPVQMQVMAAQGYPGNYDKGTRISLDAVDESDELVVFHAGTQDATDGAFTAQGGRVLNINAQSSEIAQAKAYAGCEKSISPRASTAKTLAGARLSAR